MTDHGRQKQRRMARLSWLTLRKSTKSIASGRAQSCRLTMVSRQGEPCPQDNQGSDCSRERRERLPPNLQANCRRHGRWGERLSEFVFMAEAITRAWVRLAPQTFFYDGRCHQAACETCLQRPLFAKTRPFFAKTCMLSVSALRSMQLIRLLRAWARVNKIPLGKNGNFAIRSPTSTNSPSDSGIYSHGSRENS